VSGQNLYKIHFIDWKRGWVAGGPGAHIYFTDDGGRTWQRQRSLDTEESISNVHFNSLNEGYAAFENKIYKTSDGGLSWPHSYNFLPADIFTVSDFDFINDTVGWAIGRHHSQSLVLKTENGGKNWSEVYRMADQNLRAIDFTDKKTVWAVSGNGLVIKTVNGGEEWNRIVVAPGAVLNDLYAVNPDIVWMAGENGAIYRPVNLDGIHPSAINTNFPKVYIADDEEAIALLERSFDYGAGALEHANPADRIFYYRRLKGALHEVKRFYDDQKIPEGISEQMISLQKHYWAKEQNSGAEIYNETLNEENPSEEKIKRAMFHLENAVEILPDSIHPYVSLARVKMALNDNKGAITALKNVIDKMEKPGKNHFSLLIDLYLTEGEDDQLRDLADQAAELYPEEPQFHEVIANQYLKAGETDKLLGTLNTLIELDPGKSDYYSTRARETLSIAFRQFDEAYLSYERAWELREELFAESDPVQINQMEIEAERHIRKAENLESEATQLANRAISDLKEIVDLNENSHEELGLIGSIYREMAVHKYRVLTLMDEESDVEITEQQIDRYLEEAKNYFELAIDQNPAVQEYRESLYSIYLDLGMLNEAENLLEGNNL
jgi:photosystem II stability/assembly factor-like uncharacterized protein/lipopolysaccharide biosynthesis regulator YciM